MPEITVSATSPRGEDGPDDGSFVQPFVDDTAVEVLDEDLVMGI